MSQGLSGTQRLNEALLSFQSWDSRPQGCFEVGRALCWPFLDEAFRVTGGRTGVGEGLP